jgi:hypothetical protein
MRGRAAIRIRTVVVAASMAGLGACQTPGTPVAVVTSASAPAAGGMDGDIRRILTQGGLNTASPGSLQTNKMPADVQQAVAALKGGDAAPMPFGGAAGVSPVGVQALPQSSASSIAMLPTAAVAPSEALALAPAPQAQSPFPMAPSQPPLLAALAQTQAAHARTVARRAYSAPAPRLALAPAASKPTATVLALAPTMVVEPVKVAPVAPPAPVEPPPPRRF